MRPGPVLLLLCLAGLAPAAQALPETPLFQAFGPAEGLPSSQATALAQDADGYLWIGTRDGLARFDGESFRVWQHLPEDAGSIPGNAVQALLVDARNRLWVGLEGAGLAVLDAARERFSRPMFDGQAGGGVRDVWAIAQSPDGAIWYGGFGSGLFRLDPDSGAVRRFLADPARADALPGDDVLALAVDAGGALWVGTAEGLARHAEDRFVADPELDGRLIARLRARVDGSLLVGTGAGPRILHPDGRHESPAVAGAALPQRPVTSLLHDAEGALWFGTGQGLFRLHEGRLVQHLADPRRPFALPSHTVMDLLLDHEGGLWIASAGGGVARLPRDWRSFSVWHSVPDLEDAPSVLQPRGFAEASDGRVWLVGAGGGLDRLDLRSGRFERFFTAASPLPETRAFSVLETADGALWIGFQRGLARFDPGTKALRMFAVGDGPGAPLPGQIDLLLADGEDGFWLSALGAGIERRDLDGHVIERIEAGPAGGLPSADTEQMARDGSGRLWIAGGYGVLRWNPVERRFERPDGAPREPAQGLGFDPDGRVWIAQPGRLQAFAISGDALILQRSVAARDGLPAVAAGGVLPDRGGRLWLTTPRGLVRVDATSGAVRVFGLRDGLPSVEFGDRPGLVTREGLVVAASQRALVAFAPERLQGEVEAPWLRIESVSLRRDGLPLALDPSGPLALHHDDREIHLVARVMSFAEPAAVRYRFRLLGYESEWVEQRGRGERVFSQLPPGDFSFEVQASDRLGRWRGEPVRLALSVAPPWWRQAPALGGFTLSALALAILAMRAWRARLARRHALALAEQERRLALQASEAKTGFLQHLGHEVRTPMTGVLGMTELLARTALDAQQRGYVEAIGRSGEVMLRVVNDALDLARIEAGRLPLDPRPFQPGRLLEDVAAPLRAQAARKGLGFRLEALERADAWLLGDPVRLRQILLNLGGNAVKFTERGEVVLRWLGGGSGRSFEVEVEDTGPGLDAQQQARLFQRFSQAEGARTAARHGGSGLGLAIARELAQLMGGEIGLDSAPGRGSRFRVSLPLAPAAAPDEGLPSGTAVPASAPQVLALLLVEDDATVAATLTGLLQSLGHAVTVAPHALAGLSELQAGRFDAALLDLDLPGMDGLALARLLRGRGERLPLIAITARADSEAEAQARDAGLQGFLRKPLTAAQLAAALADSAAGAVPRRRRR